MKLPILIRTGDAPDNPVDSKQIDWNNRSDRKWLESHLHWAMMNQRWVTLDPESFDTI